ncbi:hypothetical protein TcasGA2_TC034188 [Tribolium castaneum]|uniref:Cytochrome P450 n=1 Tax=Tribolium castaneum TaxID=7070 RepID=A0A139WCN2_TRICA|nr:hypothetical protein TcasGA2_TC034188 [Tribolium castaneum]
MLTIILSVVLGALIYYKLIKPASFWEERNITHASAWPLIGSMWESVIQKKNFNEISADIYKKYPNDRYVGYMQFSNPALLIRDLNLIKQIGVKAFDHFHDHLAFVGVKAEPLFSKSLAILQGEEWKQMRATLSPVFTSSKMKNMYHLIYECAENFAKHFQGRKEDVEVKDIFSKFTNDVIATAAFGIQINSLEEPNNEFYLMGKLLTTFKGWQLIKFFFAQSVPRIFELTKLNIFNQKVIKYFYDIIIDNIHKREKEGIIRPDLIHLLMEARKGKLKHDNSNEGGDGFATVEESDIGKNSKQLELTEDLMVAQALIFFFAGFETISTSFSFTAYELATNPDVQKKLQKEIDSAFQENHGKISYNVLQSMKYLDQVVSESLRLWPPAPQTDRFCNTDFVLEPTKPDERRFTIEKGVTTIIPIYGIHRDPQYFPNPDKFDPERFSDENKAKIVPGTYMPFGVGPRNCIGSRLALLELKTLFFHLLSKCDIVTNSKTVIPLKISPNNGNITPKEGIHLSFKPRKINGKIFRRLIISPLTKMLTTILLTLLSALIYFKLIKPASFWETRNVPHVTSWPLVGSMFPVLTQKKHFVEISQNIYTQFPNAKCVGYVLFTKPTLLIRDLDLLKQIGVKEFDSFHDHLPFVTEATEPLLSKSLLNLLGDEWRKMRATLSPAFTSSKMKHMYQLICECAERFTQHFGNRTVDVEIKDVFSRFSNDVIASAAFGIQVDSLKEPGNEFYSMGKAVTSILNGFQMVKVFLALSFPNIAKLIQFRAIPPKVTSFFYDIIIDNIKKRKNEGIVRPDMVHLLMEAQSGKLKHDNNTEQVDGFATVEESEIGKNSNKIQLTDELIVAQALIFLLAGFDSVSTGLSFIAYELATNPDVQKKLQEEIDSVLEKNQGKDKSTIIAILKQFVKMLTLILGVILGAIIYYKLRKPAHFWAEKNIPHLSSWPIVGNMWPFVVQKKHITEIIADIYRQFPTDRYVGYYHFMTPTLLLRDVELIKQIGVKEFDSFHDHVSVSNTNTEPLLSEALTNLPGEKWKEMRATLSPAFTSSKIKNMYSLISECAENFVDFFQGREQDVEIKEVFSRFSNDVIATAAFGIRVNSVQEPNNEFYAMGRSLTTFSAFQILKIFLAHLVPKIAEFFEYRVLPRKVTDFFEGLILDNMQKREAEKIVRPDLIHLLMEARKGKLKHDNSNEGGEGFATVEESEIGKNTKQVELTDEKIVAQALLFFFAGFETVSTGVSFMAYELATNPHVQKKLQKEIDLTLQENHGKISYNVLQSMKYLDQVVCESLRLWPPAPQTDRLCNKNFVIEASKPHERTFTVEKDTMVMISMFAIHRDPQYFPDPEKFDPERFSDENKAKIVPGTYMPFGVGPRNCIAKFDIVPNGKTVIPIKISPSTANMVPQEGIHLTFKPRL